VGGVVLLLFGVGIIVGIAVAMQQYKNSSPNGNRDFPLPTPSASQTEEPSPSPVESPSIEVSDVPTDVDEVKSDLQDLEEQWTEANIKGDKVALARILADDYSSGTGSDRHGKRQYVNELEPDTTVTDWSLSDLNVTLTGERATAHGVLTQETTKGTRIIRFTDTFVWRDHRWQAIGSVTTQVQ